MSRDIRLYLDDIVECSDKVGRYTLGLTFEQFRNSDIVVDAVTRNLELIGEASEAVPDDLRSKYPHVPWRKMTGLRDVVVHGYFRVDVQLIWDIVQREVPIVRQKSVPSGGTRPISLWSSHGHAVKTGTQRGRWKVE